MWLSMVNDAVSMDWSSRTDPSIRRTSAATTPPSDSFTKSPGTSPPAGTVVQILSRRTDAFSASRDLSAARVAWARPSWKKTRAALKARRSAMIAPRCIYRGQSRARRQPRASMEPVPKTCSALSALDSEPYRQLCSDQASRAAGALHRW